MLWQKIGRKTRAISQLQTSFCLERDQGILFAFMTGRGREKDSPFRTITALRVAIPVFLEKGFKFKLIDEK